jgi:L-ribulose-5-phosphate 3-epimerase
MDANRREFLKTIGMAAGTIGSGVGLARVAAADQVSRVGMCDWNLGKSCDPEAIPRAREARLHGIQVSVGTAPDRVPLRDKAVRQKYVELGRQYGVAFNSVAAGSILNQIPLKSEPQSAVYVIDAIEAAAALGAKNILIAFFGNGDLRLQDSTAQLRNLAKSGPASYELDAHGVSRVVEALRQIAPRAADAGVVLGLEDTLTAEQNLEIIERIGSPMVQVYYDVGNSTHYGYDVPTELRKLGAGRICEIHLKDWKTPQLGSPDGEVAFSAVAAACREIRFDKWFVLESSGRKDRFLADTLANVAFVERLFLS